jgi:folate-binding protein YgfZ
MDKAVIRVSGNAEKFLSGLTSNSLDQPRNAFLNLHGRIIATFDQVKSGQDEFLLVIFPAAWDALKAHTDKFARLSKTVLEKTALKVYFDLDGDAALEPGDYVIAQKSGRLVITPRILTQTISAGAFTAFRLQYQIPIHGIDYQDEMVLNVHEFDFVSYTKGCFLGQEPVAKVHNRSKPTWKLAVRFADELSGDMRAKMTSLAADPAAGREQGFVFVPN